MDTQRMADAVSFTRLAVTLTFDPSAEPSERWLACIGFDWYGAGAIAQEALDNAMNREALGPESVYHDADELEPLPFADDQDDVDDLDPFGELVVLQLA